MYTTYDTKQLTSTIMVSDASGLCVGAGRAQVQEGLLYQGTGRDGEELRGSPQHDSERKCVCHSWR